MSMNFDLKQFEGLKTPFYWYDSQLLDQTLQTVKSLADRHGYHVHDAVKANGNLEILRSVNAAGLGTDCVSGNEVKLAARSGFESSPSITGRRMQPMPRAESFKSLKSQ